MTDSSAGTPGHRLGGALLALGSAVFVTGCVMYAISLCGLALVGGAGYMLGLFVGWQLNGPMLIASAVCMGALGVQIARKEG